MKRRLYFLLPDVASATRTANDLLLARVEDRHMHFLAKRGTDLGELHEASYFIKTDFARGAGIGLFVGALGVWLGTMAATALPNSRLKQFDDEIRRGKVLLILDVPYQQVDRIREIVSSSHPEVVLSAQETRYPAFP